MKQSSENTNHDKGSNSKQPKDVNKGTVSPATGTPRTNKSSAGKPQASLPSTGKKYANKSGADISTGKSKRSAREAALEVLVRTEQDRSYSNLLLNQILQQYHLDKQDAGLTTEIVYGTIQRQNTIDYFLNRFVTKGLVKLEPWVRSLLRLSYYQMLYLDRVPDHAIVNEAVNLAKKKGHSGISGMVNGVLRNVIRNKEALQLPTNLSAVDRIALTYSHPNWMVKRWIDQIGEARTELLCEANNKPPHVSIRVNTMKLSRNELILMLNKAGVDTAPSELAADGILVKNGGNMALTPLYEEGLFSIQDESSMLVAETLQSEPGERILDCCAAPGGKTAHIAEKMGNRGEIWACDIHEHKEKLIREQATRLGLTSVHTLVSDARDLPRHFAEASFDRILLDAPCSGLGVIRRKPDMKWNKREQDLNEVCVIQKELLDSIHPLLKVGGTLVYSTCTMEYNENEGRVREFLDHHPNFEWDQLKPIEIYPYEHLSDGFFIARLRKRA